MVYIVIGILLIVFAIFADRFFVMRPEAKKRIKNTGIVLAIAGGILQLFRYFKNAKK